MTAPPAPRPCPHCGLDPGPGQFCRQCGVRLAKRLSRPAAWRVLSGVLWIVAVPAVCFGGVLSACGILFWGGPPRAMPEFLATGVTSLSFGVVIALIAWLVQSCTRKAREGCHDVPFGRPEEGPRP